MAYYQGGVRVRALGDASLLSGLLYSYGRCLASEKGVGFSPSTLKIEKVASVIFFSVSIH